MNSMNNYITDAEIGHIIATQVGQPPLLKEDGTVMDDESFAIGEARIFIDEDLHPEDYRTAGGIELFFDDVTAYIKDNFYTPESYANRPAA